ncbi:MAG: hypothetical protein FGM54_00770 [Chitinophagaceae bacterium]|nr:hypothetical protein [Chitinophagaceae bacterium]
MLNSYIFFLQGSICLLVSTSNLMAQSVDTFSRNKPDSIRLARARWHWTLYYDVHSTLTADAQCFMKQTAPNPQLVLYYNLDIKSRFALNTWMMETILFNDYGFTWYVDSLHNKSTDRLQYKFSLSKSWTKYFDIDISYNTQTILFPGYQYQATPQGMKAFKQESYMSPGFIYISAGLSTLLPNAMRFQVGLASCKIARLRDTSLFASRSTQTIAGIERGKKQKVEGGINFQATCPLIKLRHQAYLEGTGLLFVPLFEGQYNFDMNVVTHVKLWRFGRLSWRHQCQFNSSNKSAWLYRQWITLGAYLNNHLK